VLVGETEKRDDGPVIAVWFAYSTCCCDDGVGALCHDGCGSSEEDECDFHLGNCIVCQIGGVFRSTDTERMVRVELGKHKRPYYT
jgi:hypothetical protein